MRIAIDVVQRRPGCVNVQAGLGGDPAAARALPVESWLLAPTPDMRVGDVTAEQLAQFNVELERRAAAGEFTRIT